MQIREDLQQIIEAALAAATNATLLMAIGLAPTHCVWHATLT